MVKVPDWDQFKSSAPLPKPGPLPIENWTKEELIKIMMTITNMALIKMAQIQMALIKIALIKMTLKIMALMTMNITLMKNYHQNHNPYKRKVTDK